MVASGPQDTAPPHSVPQLTLPTNQQPRGTCLGCWNGRTAAQERLFVQGSQAPGFQGKFSGILSSIQPHLTLGLITKQKQNPPHCDILDHVLYLFGGLGMKLKASHCRTSVLPLSYISKPSCILRWGLVKLARLGPNLPSSGLGLPGS